MISKEYFITRILYLLTSYGFYIIHILIITIIEKETISALMLRSVPFKGIQTSNAAVISL